MPKLTSWIKCKDQQPSLPGWYDTLWNGSSSAKETRCLWTGYVWLYDNHARTTFGNIPQKYPDDAWRGLSQASISDRGE